MQFEKHNHFAFCPLHFAFSMRGPVRGVRGVQGPPPTMGRLTKADHQNSRLSIQFELPQPQSQCFAAAAVFPPPISTAPVLPMGHGSAFGSSVCFGIDQRVF